MAGKSTRITVDLGSEALVKSLKISAIERHRTVREIVVEALELWLANSNKSGTGADAAGSSASVQTTSGDKDYVSLMENLNRYRGVGGA